MPETIKGSDAIIYFYKNEFIPFGCATTFTLTTTADKLPTREISNTGVWKTYIGSNLSWAISLTGVTTIVDADMFTSWDIIDNQVSFIDILTQITFTDSAGNIKSVRGKVLVDTSTLTIAVKDPVMSDFAFTGNGELMRFTGSIPCDSEILTITTTGGTGTDATETVEFTNTDDVNVDPANTVNLLHVTSVQNIQPGMFIKIDSINYPITGVTYSAALDVYFLTVTGDPTEGYHTAVSYQIVSVENGNVNVTYTYNGTPIQVEYKVDNSGSFIKTLIGQAISITSPSVGEHQIEIIPLCDTGYEGTGLVETFEVTNGLTCDTVINAIIITGTGPATATNSYTGGATAMRYRIDGGVWTIQPITTAVSLNGLSLGSHTIEEVPVCENGALGTGTSQTFDITTTAGINIVNYSFAITATTSRPLFSIRQNGVPIPLPMGATSGSLNVLTGDTIIVSVSDLEPSFVSNHIGLHVSDTTTAVALYGNIVSNPATLTYTFTTQNSDSYDISATVTS